MLHRIQHLFRRLLLILPQKLVKGGPRTLAITSIKDEGSYILEWICFHKVIGFDKVLVITNDNSDSTVDILHRIASTFSWVHFIDHSVSKKTVPQMQALRLARSWMDANDYIGWALVTDIDEFIMLFDASSIKDFLNKHKRADVIFLNWRIYGSAGYTDRPAGLVVEKYNRCAQKKFSEHYKFKSIFKYYPGDMRHIGIHWPVFKNPSSKKFVFSDGSAIDPKILTAKPYSDHSRICFSGIQLNHYITKSWDEFQSKRLRGGGGIARVNRDIDERHTHRFFKRMDRNDVNVPMPEIFVTQTKALMREVYKKSRLDDTRCRAQYFGLDDAPNIEPR